MWIFIRSDKAGSSPASQVPKLTQLTTRSWGLTILTCHLHPSHYLGSCHPRHLLSKWLVWALALGRFLSAEISSAPLFRPAQLAASSSAQLPRACSVSSFLQFTFHAGHITKYINSKPSIYFSFEIIKTNFMLAQCHVSLKKYLFNTISFHLSLINSLIISFEDH